MRYRRLLATLLFPLALFAAKPRPNASVTSSVVLAAPPSVAGQSVTLLPDGSWLVAGGMDADGLPSANAHIVISLSGQQSEIRLSMMQARVGHTANVLPDGTVMILGGFGADGKPVRSAELFHPDTQSFELLSPAPAPRAFHTATVIPDGSVVIAGGVSFAGDTLSTIEIWDSVHRLSRLAPGQLADARRNHTANILSDGRIAFQGGKGPRGDDLRSAEIFDATTGTLAFQRDWTAKEDATTTNEVVLVHPANGATGVAVDSVPGILFARPVQVQHLASAITLSAPEGSVNIKVVAAEGGRLAFINPEKPLSPKTTYTVTISGVASGDGMSVPFASFAFTTGDAHDGPSLPPQQAPTANPDPFASKWRALPALQAAPGVTALAGQVLDLKGEPVQHMTLKINTVRVETDATGRFLLSKIGSGHQVLVIDGRTASRKDAAYGLYEYGAEIKAGVTNVLPFTIWMTPLDLANATVIPSPTTKETVIKTPRLPGLELHLAPGTTILDYDGKPARQISITLIPLNQPPFPLPHVPVPIYFTIQPGGSYIKVAKTSPYQGARLFYPNSFNYPAGSIFSFWNYDADKRGWFVYGWGRVSPDRSQVVPNPGVAIYQLTGAMVSNPTNAPPTGPSPGNSNGTGGEPVDLATGLFVYRKTDLALQDVIPIALTRTYRQSDSTSRAFGVGATHDYDIFLVGDHDSQGYTYQDLILPDGGRVHFTRISPCTGQGGFCNFSDAVYEHTTSGTDFYGARIAWTGGWTLTKKNGTVYTFPDSDNSNQSQAAAIVTMHDRHGNSVTFTRTGNNLTQITSPNGHWIKLTYDSSNRVIQAQDNINRTVNYSYNANGNLTQVTDASGGVTNYTYDSLGELLSIQDPRGLFFLNNQYDGNGRVVRQTQADQTAFQFNYSTDPVTGAITETDVTDPAGNVKRVTFVNGYTASVTLANNDAQNRQTFTYNRDPNTNLLTSFLDPLSRETDFTYDVMGNLTSITRLAHSTTPLTTSFQYEPIFNQLALTTDPMGHVTQYQYDVVGNLTTVIDPLQRQTNFTYFDDGLVKTVSDPLLNMTQFTYDAGKLSSMIDPMQNASTMFYDAAGRLITATDPLGNTYQYQYDALDQVTAVVDPAGGITSFTYDPNGNMLTMQDPRQQGTTAKTSYTYDNRDRVTGNVDPLMRSEVYTYDAMGNLTTVTDARGKMTTYKYDSLNRRNFVGYGTTFNGGIPSYESTVTFAFDGGNRMTSVTDSAGGVITPQYDLLNRLVSKATPQGTITYGYDNDNRQTSMTVAGQPQVTYTYDDGNRITQVAQGSSTTTIAYDANDRRTSVSLPNGLRASYGYDTSSRLTGISYQMGSTSLGNLSYTYDAANHRLQASGTLAQTGMPQPIASASYDDANELTMWNGAALTYDGTGNLITDGANSYSWNARNQLVSISGSNNSSFLYGADGQRTQNANGVSFLYDENNPVQELSGTTVTANLQTGATDETWTRTDSSGAYVPLVDALGSTVALANSAGVLSTRYTYDPFGNTIVAGTGSSNPSQFTGRESDPSGLYFQRARYYSPALHRFISGDPAGLRGGINLYQYAESDPVDLSDPLGLWGTVAHNHLIEHALQPCGVSAAMIKEIEDDSARFDFQTGTGQEMANFHAMAREGQDLTEAKLTIGNIINDQMDIARDTIDSNRSYAVDQMAIGMHTMMDMTSPAHFTGPPDTGMPIPWCSPMGCNLQQIRAHSWTDHDGIENSSDITAAIYDENDAMLRGAYEFVFGHPLSCKTQ
jgi:RHS repeat-associated protein